MKASPHACYDSILRDNRIVVVCIFKEILDLFDYEGALNVNCYPIRVYRGKENLSANLVRK